MTNKVKQSGRPMSHVDYTMLLFVAIGLLVGGIMLVHGKLLTGFLGAALFIMVAAFIGEAYPRSE